MRTVTETPTFQRYAASVWSDSEREEFICWIAANPLAGDPKFDNLPIEFLTQLKEAFNHG
jgi:hypothetical protein